MVQLAAAKTLTFAATNNSVIKKKADKMKSQRLFTGKEVFFLNMLQHVPWTAMWMSLEDMPVQQLPLKEYKSPRSAS